jgi:hypothetical protein
MSDRQLLAKSAIEQYLDRMLDDEVILSLTQQDPHEFAFNLAAAVAVDRDLAAGKSLEETIDSPRKGVVIRASLRRFSAAIRRQFDNQPGHNCYEFAHQRAADVDSLADQF